MDPRSTAVVVAWRSAGRVSACLDALLAQPGLAVLVVDNASTDGTAEVLAGYGDRIRVLRTADNLGFAGGARLGVAEVRTPYVALVNDDAVVRAGWLGALEQVLDDDPGCAAVTGKVLLGDGRVNSAGGVVDRLGHGRDRGFGEPDDGAFDLPVEVFYAPATACLYRTGAVRESGSFDAAYFLYHEDVDLAWRLRLAGAVVRYTPRAVVDHAHGASTGAAQGSRLHSVHDARNRLLTLTKDAPGATAVAGVLRLPATALSLLVRALLGPAQRRAAEVQHARGVAAALPGFLRLLPHALRGRRRAPGVRSRAEVLADARRLAGPSW